MTQRVSRQTKSHKTKLRRAKKKLKLENEITLRDENHETVRERKWKRG